MRTQSHRQPGRAVLLLTILALASSGCSLVAAPDYPNKDVTHARDVATASDQRCPRDGTGLGASDFWLGPGPTSGTVPADFRPERVRVCRLRGEPEQTSTGLRYTVAEETSTAEPELLQSLSLADQEFDRRDHAACAANYTPPVYLLLLDRQDHAIRALLPADPCGSPRTEVQEAIQALRPAQVTTYTFDQRTA